MSYKLQVNHVIAHDLTMLPVFEKSPEDFLCRVKDDSQVKKLTFFEASTVYWKTFLLKRFNSIEELYFSPNSYPVIPADTYFGRLEKLDLNLLKRSEDEELKLFFTKAFFPSLKKLRLGFICERDFTVYACGHYFVGLHFATLKVLQLFLDIGVRHHFSNNQARHVSSCEDPNNFFADVISSVKSDASYAIYLQNIQKLKLESFCFNLSPNEGQSPWNLTLKLIASQRNLQHVKVQEPHAQAQIAENLIATNGDTLKQITVPDTLNFNCEILQTCPKLMQFSFGEDFASPDKLPGTHCALRNFVQFPTFPSIVSVSIASPLHKDEVMSLSKNLGGVKELMVRGFPEEFYTKEDVLLILKQRRILKKLVMLVSMESEQKQKLQCWLWTVRELVVIYFLEHPVSQMAEFKIQIAKFQFEPFKTMQVQLMQADKDLDMEPIFS
jgi:hypothetical protein